MSTTRPYQEGDRERAAALLGDARPLDAPGSHAHVADAGADAGLALWREELGEACLGPVIVPPGAPREQFYRLVLACAEDARARGFTHGRFRVLDERLLARIQRDFTVEPRACGWEANTGTPVEWEIAVEFEDAIAQLRRVI